MPHKPVRVILPREVCTDPETAAKIMCGEIQKGLKTLRVLPLAWTVRERG